MRVAIKIVDKKDAVFDAESLEQEVRGDRLILQKFGQQFCRETLGYHTEISATAPGRSVRLLGGGGQGQGRGQ
eukprot:1741878-Rhodomonas_salina.1